MVTTSDSNPLEGNVNSHIVSVSGYQCRQCFAVFTHDDNRPGLEQDWLAIHDDDGICHVLKKLLLGNKYA